VPLQPRRVLQPARSAPVSTPSAHGLRPRRGRGGPDLGDEEPAVMRFSRSLPLRVAPARAESAPSPGAAAGAAADWAARPLTGAGSRGGRRAMEDGAPWCRGCRCAAAPRRPRPAPSSAAGCVTPPRREGGSGGRAGCDREAHGGHAEALCKGALEVEVEGRDRRVWTEEEPVPYPASSAGRLPPLHRSARRPW